MNPLSVLTAQDIMEPIKGRAPTDVVAMETPLAKIMDQLGSSIEAVAVHDDAGEPVGQINPQSIVNALNK